VGHCGNGVLLRGSYRIIFQPGNANASLWKCTYWKPAVSLEHDLHYCRITLHCYSAEFLSSRLNSAAGTAKRHREQRETYRVFADNATITLGSDFARQDVQHRVSSIYGFATRQQHLHGFLSPDECSNSSPSSERAQEFYDGCDDDNGETTDARLSSLVRL